MKSFKNQLNKELDSIVSPSLSEHVFRVPIASLHQQKEKRRMIWIPCAISMALCSILVGSYLILKTPSTPKNQNSVLLTLEINPKVSFLSDDDGNTIKISSLNKDADVVLADESFYQSLLNQPLESSLESFVDQAAKLGYLNLNENGNAIRVSTYSSYESEMNEKISSSLQQYFIEQGSYTFVVMDHLDIEKFCEELNLSSSIKFEDLRTQFSKMNTYFTQKEVSTLQEDQLKKYYEDEFLYQPIKDSLYDIINEKLDKIQENAIFVQSLVDLNDKIMDHPDNPMLLFKDYWNVKNLSNAQDYTIEFKNLMDEMSEQLQRYADTYRYGISISSKIELTSIADHYQSIPFEQIVEILNDFSDYNFNLFIEPILDILNDIGEDVSEIRKLITLPNSLEDYFDKVFLSLQLQSDKLKLHFQDLYNQTRETLSEKDYFAYQEEVLQQYGSLNEYWNNIKK